MASLSPISGVLGLRKAKHLLRRASFAYNKDIINTFADLNINDALTHLTSVETNAWEEPYDPLPTDNPDAFWLSSSELPNTFDGQARKRRIVSSWWWYNALNQVSLRHKLTFFLHTSFTVSKDDGSGTSTHFYDHIRLLDFMPMVI